MTLPTVSLTKGQIASFQEKGYLVLDALTTPDEVDRLRLIYDRLFSDKTGWDSGNQFDLAGTDEEDQATLPQLLGPSQYAPELKETRYLRNAQEIASQLLGEEMSPRNGEHMIYKPPGSHKLDVLPHHPINHDPRIHGLEVDDPETWASRGVACPVRAGGATLHAAYMLHYAGPNRTVHPRRAYTLTFRLPAVPRETAIDNYWSRSQQTARAERAEKAKR